MLPESLRLSPSEGTESMMMALAPGWQLWPMSAAALAAMPPLSGRGRRGRGEGTKHPRGGNDLTGNAPSILKERREDHGKDISFAGDREVKWPGTRQAILHI